MSSSIFLVLPSSCFFRILIPLVLFGKGRKRRNKGQGAPTTIPPSTLDPRNEREYSKGEDVWERMASTTPPDFLHHPSLPPSSFVAI